MVEDVVDVANDIAPVDHERPPARHPQRHVESGSVLRPVHVVAAEHRVALLRHAALAREVEEQRDRLGRHTVLREVRVDPGGLQPQTLDAGRVLGEQLAEMTVAHLLVVAHERLPGVSGGERVGHVVPRRPGAHGP